MTNPEPPLLWIAVTDKIGHVNQCIALTDALGRAPDRIERITGFNLRHGPLIKAVRRVRGLAQTLRLVAGAPRRGRLVLLVSGRSSELAAVLLRRRMGARLLAISVGVPVRHARAIDLAIVNEAELPKWHRRRDAARAEAGEIVITGALARRFPAADPPDPKAPPLTAVLIGGENKHFALTGGRFRDQLSRLRAIADEGSGRVEIVLSRRTSAATEALIRETFAGAAVHIAGRDQSRGYRAVLERAARFVVTPDSVTMLSEVCLAGKPVYVFDLEGLPRSDGSGRRLVDAMVARGVVKVFDGEIGAFEPAGRLDEATRIAPLVRERIDRWAGGG